MISGGGTGGHVYPAIAIADAVKSMAADAEILFVGAIGKMEMEKVPEAGYEIKGLWISGLQRKLSARNLLFPVKLVHSLIRAAALVRRFKPDVVVGVGGYASGAVMRIATQRKIPTLIQEQNSYAGLTNKWVASKVNTICVAYPGMEKYFPKEKIKLTGNPVRKDIWENTLTKEEARASFELDTEKPVLLILGGSLGARTLNECIEAQYKRLTEAGIQIIWQCGKFYHEQLLEKHAEHLPSSVKLMPFIRKIPAAYSAANIVVSRAGALTVSELCLTGLPSILIPSPNVAENHQMKNAKALEKIGAGIILEDDKAKNNFYDTVITLMQDETKQLAMRKAIQQLAKPKAAQDIASYVLALAKR